MRISDWSSDVCSSDLASTFALRIILKKVSKDAPGREGTRQGPGRRLAGLAGGLAGSGLRGPEGIGHRCGSSHAAGQAPGLVTYQLLLVLRGSRADRKSTRLNSSH